MNTPNVQLMAEARASLNGKWGQAALFSLLYIVISLAVQSVPAIGTFAWLFLMGPFLFGAATYWLGIARGQEVNINQLFAGFKYFINTSVAGLLMVIFVLLWMVLLIVPGLVAAFSYAMVFFILADDPSLSATEAIRRSKAMMYGHKWELFLLLVRFIGWWLLGLLTLGIGFLWVGPYIQVSTAKFYEDIRPTPEPEAEPVPAPEPEPVSVPTPAPEAAPEAPSAPTEAPVAG